MAAIAARMAPADARPSHGAQVIPLWKGTLDWQRLRERCEQRLLGLEAARWSWWAHWRLLARYIQPRLARFLPAQTTSANRGLPKNQNIINSTATIAATRFAAGMMAGATSPARPWFNLTTADDDLNENPAVKLWLDAVRKRMLRVFASSNFYRSIATCYEELGVFGTAAMLIYEDFEDVIRCYPLAVGQFYLANDHRLNVTTLYRKFSMTVEELVGRFGLDACSDTVRQLWENGTGRATEVIVAHGIELNDGMIRGALGLDGKRYREVYWEWGARNSRTDVLEVAGYHEKPFLAARWNVTDNDAYGRSPGMDAIGDVIAIQVQEKRKAQAIEKIVNPPLVADARLRNEPATTIPGGVTYVAGGDVEKGFKSLYQIQPDIEHLVQDIAKFEGRVKSAFFEDLFLMISQLDTVRTATEVVERKEEKMLMLGPPLERMHDELLAPAVERLYNVMSRGGLLPAVPDELKGQEILLEFVSTLAQAQKATVTTSMERVASFVGSLAAGQEGAGKAPEALDKLDTDELIDEYADAVGAPPKIIVSAQRVAEIRAKRQAAQQQQNAVQTAMAGAQGAATLSKVDVGGGQNAVQKMLGLAA